MLKFYLKTLRPLAEILKSEEGRIGIVLCNESGDLDSVVCSTILAAFLQKTLGFSHFPLLPFSRDDLRLKTEVLFCFEKKLDLSIVNTLPCLEDFLSLTSDEKWKNKNVEVSLVDHNLINVAPITEALDDRVVRVIDHRQCDRPVKESEDINIELVGSCSTLIAEKIFQHTLNFEDDSDILNLLRWTILLDTVNLSEAFKKVTPKDVEILKKIETTLQFSSEILEDRKNICEEMDIAKRDISNFTLEQILKKDQKVIRLENPSMSFSVSTSPQSIEAVANQRKASFSKDFDAFATAFDLTVMLSVQDILIHKSGEYWQTAVNSLLEKNPDIAMENLADSETELKSIFGENSVFMRRKNPAYSRKKIIPILKDAILNKAQ